MKNILSSFALLICAVAVNSAAAADAPVPNRYHAAIVPRNLFQLRSPETPPPVDHPRQVRTVSLVGLTSILGGKLAVLRVAGHVPAREYAFMLGEGAASDGVRVFEINLRAGTARIELDGQSRVLDIRKDSPSP